MIRLPLAGMVSGTDKPSWPDKSASRPCYVRVADGCALPIFASYLAFHPYWSWTLGHGLFRSHAVMVRRGPNVTQVSTWYQHGFSVIVLCGLAAADEVSIRLAGGIGIAMQAAARTCSPYLL